MFRDCSINTSFSVFRIFDKVGQGFIGVDRFREILREIDEKVSDDELDGIIAYVSPIAKSTTKLLESMYVT